jgi:hypothetical protein
MIEKDQVLEIENDVFVFGLIADSYFDAITEYLKTITKWSDHELNDNKMFCHDGSLVMENDDFVYGVISEIVEEIRIEAELRFNKKLVAHPFSIFKTIPGHTPHPHCDNSHLDGTPKEERNFSISAVCYLSDGFTGGELVFPDLDLGLEPNKATVIMFPSGIEFMHYVDEVKSGERWALPLWFIESE